MRNSVDELAEPPFSSWSHKWWLRWRLVRAKTLLREYAHRQVARLNYRGLQIKDISAQYFFPGPIWTGDNMANWEHLKASLPMVLTLNLVGLPFSGGELVLTISYKLFSDKQEESKCGAYCHQLLVSITLQSENFSPQWDRPFLNCLVPLFQSEAACKTFHMKMSFICMWMKTHFHIKGYTPRLALKKRYKTTRKWPIELMTIRTPVGHSNLRATGRLEAG